MVIENSRSRNKYENRRRSKKTIGRYLQSSFEFKDVEKIENVLS